jgi:2-polyprenyl-3-methyl-5-hydroxy-6-metoxy-1,4-benzoquinol methylase
MSGERSREDHIVASWHRNAAPWTEAVRGCAIESRRLVTDRAIIDAVLDRNPSRVLDIGCGEGWLARRLGELGLEVTGIDVVPELIQRARERGGTYVVASYEEVARGVPGGRFDLAVCNFSLLGKDSVDTLCGAMASLLEPAGTLVVQTLHPLVACGGEPYVDGWRVGSWAGCGTGFSDPAPWYFRTLGGWLSLFRDHGLRLVDLREPLHPVTRMPVSAIFVVTPA